MARYSPTIREDPGGPLDFSPITSALRTMQDNRLRRRQLQLWEDREAEDQRIQRERERVAGEERVNDVRRRGGVPLLQAPIGQPTLRDLTPSSETEVPRALGGGRIALPLGRRAGIPMETRPAGSFVEMINGESFLMDPLYGARLQERARELQETPKRIALGVQRGRVLREMGLYEEDAPDELGRMDNSLFSSLAESRKERRSLQQAAAELRQQGAYYGVADADTLPLGVLAQEVKRRQGRLTADESFRDWKRKEDYSEGLIRARPKKEPEPKDDTPAFLTPAAIGRTAGDLVGKPKTDAAGDPLDEDADGVPDVVGATEAAKLAGDKVRAGKRAAAAEEYTRAGNAYKQALQQAGNDPAAIQKVKDAYMAARAAIERRYGSLQ